MVGEIQTLEHLIEIVEVTNFIISVNNLKLI